MIPGVETVQEAYEALLHGAHFVKFCGITPIRAAEINSSATHGIFPLFVTGGVTEKKSRCTLKLEFLCLRQDGTLCWGTLTRSNSLFFCVETVLSRLKIFMEAFDRARREHLPQETEPETDEYIGSLQNYHHF